MIAGTTAPFRTVDSMENSYHDLRMGFLEGGTKLRGRMPRLKGAYLLRL